MIKVRQKGKGFQIAIFILILITLVGLLINNLDKNGLLSLSKIKNELVNRASSEDILSISDVATAPQYGIAAGGGLIFMNQSYLDTYFGTLKNLGVTWIRFDIDWHIIQANGANSYDWTGTDRVIATAKRHKIRMLGTLAYSPKWAEAKGCTNGFGCPPENPKDFRRFVNYAVRRYNSSIIFWEIWNEPNNPSFWDKNLSVPKYISILKEAYQQIKIINPRATVILGGLAVTGDNANSPYEYLKKVYKLKGNRYFDAVGVHPYTYPYSANSPVTWNGWKELSLIHIYMTKFGDGNKKLWITEYGAPTYGKGKSSDINPTSYQYHFDYLSESAQTKLLKSAYTLYNKQSSYMGPFFWYSLIDRGTDINTTENFFGLLRSNWSSKPAYIEFKRLLKSK